MPDNQPQPSPANNGFDPDAFVAAAKKQTATQFDPDAFIKQASGGFDPNAFLDESSRNIANNVLAKHHAGEAELNDDQLRGLIETAYKDRTPFQGVKDWASGVGSGIKQEAMHAMFPSWYPESGVAEKIKGGLSTAGKAAGELLSTGDEDSKVPQNVMAGVASAPLDILNVGQSLGVGAANLADQGLPGSHERRMDRILRSEKLAHDINASVKGVNDYLGADPADPLNESTRFLAQAFLPVKGAGELSPAIAKGADAIVESAPSAVRWGAPAVGGAAATVAGHPTLAKEIVAAGYGLPTTVKTIRTVIRKVKEAAGDTTPESTSLFNDFVDAASKAPSQTPVFTYIKQGVDDRIASLQKVTDDFRSANQGKIKFADDPTVDVKDLKGQDKELREKLDQLKFLQQRSESLKTASDVNKVLTYGGKLSLATAGNVLAGGAIMGGISASQAQPQQVEQAAKEGFQTGAALSLPFAPTQAHGALQDLRMSQGRDALEGRGAKIVDTASLQGLTDAQKTNVLTTAGAANSVGVKTVVLSPEEYAQMIAPQRPDVVPPVESAPQEQQVPQQQAPNGHYDPNTKTIYLNRDAIGEGTAGHELQHPLQQLWGGILRESSPESMAEFEKLYDSELAKTGQKRGLSMRAERDAEVGRVLLQNTPIEAFYGGESGADVVKRVASNLLQRIMPDRYAKTMGTTELGAPYSRGDLGEMQQRMFRLGEEAAKAPRNAPSEPGATSIRSSEQTQPTAPTEAPTKSVGQVVSEVDQVARPQVIPAEVVQARQDVIDAINKTFRASKKEDLGRNEGLVDEAIARLQKSGEPLTTENIFRETMNPRNVVGEVDQSAKSAQTAQQVSEVDQIAKSTPQTNEEPSRTPTETVPQETTEPAPERGVEGEVQAPAESADHPDYQAIRTQAEAAKREELAGTRRKTKEAEISRAGLEAMAQAHAGHVGSDNDLVTWRTDRFGDTSIGGKRLDLDDPFHQHLIEKAGLTPKQVEYVNQFSDNMGKLLGLENYSHAAKEGEASGVSRKAEQKESTAQQRAEKQGDTQNAPVNIIPTWIKFNQPSNRVTVHGFNPNKFLANGAKLESYTESRFKKAYPKGVNDPQIAEDLSDWLTNNRNGYTGDGRKQIEGTPLTQVKPNADYKPAIIPHDRFQVLNAMMSSPEPMGKTPKSADAQILGQQNAGFVRPNENTFNQVRAKLGEESGLLENVNESLRPENISGKVSNEPVADEHLLRPSGAKPETVKAIADVIGEKGTPRYSQSGFMPATPKLSEAAQKVYDAAKGTKDEFDIVDASHLTPEDRRALAESGISFNVTRKNEIVARYPRRLREEDLRQKVTMRAVARELGLRYDGLSLGGKAHQFTDDKTKSTLDVPVDSTPEQVKAIFEASRANFKDLPQFMPSTDKRAVDKAAIRMPDGQIFSDVFHPLAFSEAINHYPTSTLAKWLEKYGDNFVQTGWVDKQGNWLDRKEAQDRAEEIGQATKGDLDSAREHFGNVSAPKGLESLEFAKARKFKGGGLVKVPRIVKPLSRVAVKQRPRALASNAA